MNLPKPMFANIGRLYAAVVSQGIPPGSLNRENADTIMRKLVKTSWLEENRDLHQLWTLGGDNWGDTIKLVRSYSAEVNKFCREQKAKEKLATKSAPKESK
jgi:hypothetical protein